MIWPRILTASILIPCVIAVIWFVPTMAFIGISLVLFCLIAWEWAGLCGLQAPSALFLYLAIFLLGTAVLLNLPALLLPWVFMAGALLWSCLLYWTLSYQGKAPLLLQQPTARATIGLLVLWLAWFGLIQIRFQALGPQWILTVLLVVWSCDSAAYFTGRALGKKRFAPLISPNKTWAGFWGGVVGALVVSAVVFGLMDLSSTPMRYFLAMFVLVLLAIYGDLFESLVKRVSDKKDSGTLLPGHGGFLDRMDSLLPTFPWLAAYLLWLH